MQLKNENAQRVGQNSKGGSAVQCDVADVSVSHIFPGVFSSQALAFALLTTRDLSTGKRGVTNDHDAAAEILAMGWPVQMQSVELINGAPVTWWCLCGDNFDRGYFDDWLQRFDEGLDEIRLQAAGRDRLALERLDWFLEAEENRTRASRLALPSSAEYAAIAERVIQGASQ